MMLMVAWSICRSDAQQLVSGSNGSYGPLNITENTTLPLPADGVFHCTTLSIAANATLSFTRNGLNTPVYLLALGDVVVDGTIDVSGKTPAGVYQGGEGGPAGFDGGPGGFASGDAKLPGGNGLGPGGGKHGTAGNGASGPDYNQAGSFGTPSSYNTATYGTSLLIPIIGGSGGGGADGGPVAGGGGGGGAILIASNTRIQINSTGLIQANGGYSYYNDGSGGAIRLVAPRVYGTGVLSVVGGNGGGGGRMRIDSIYKYEPTASGTSLAFRYAPSTPGLISIGSTMLVFPPNMPKLRLSEAAGSSIPESAPTAVRVELPLGTDPNRTVVVQAKDFGAKVPIRVTLTPQSGDSISYDAEIDNSTANPASATVNVTFPINQLVQVNAWSR